MPCSQDDCQGDARWRPVLELRSKKDSKPLRLHYIKLGYCDEHQRTTTIDTVLSDEGAAKIAKQVRELGLGKIEPRLTTLAWKPLTSAEVSHLSSGQDHTLTDTTLPF